MRGIKLLPEAKLILLLTQVIIKNKEEEEIQALITTRNINWERFKRFIIYHDLAPFISPALKKYNSLLPSYLVKFLNISYEYYLFKCFAIWEEFIKIVNIFNKDKISIVPIKGIAILKDLYERPYLRVIRDLDILVKKQDLLKIEEILERLGYTKDLCGFKEKYWKQRQYHIAFRRNDSKLLSLPIEIHWGLDYPSKNRQAPSLDLWNRLSEIKIENSKIKLTSPEDVLFILALHQRRFGKILSLKYICDVALLLKKYSSKFDWDYVLEQAHNRRICTVLYFILFQTKILLKVNLSKEVLTQLNISAWKKKIIYWFIKKDTFPCSSNFPIKKLYLIAHFLLYDAFLEAISYFVTLPQEQFAKFYNLKPYTINTKLLYKIRLITMPLLYLFFYLKEKFFRNKNSNKEVILYDI
mgnify:CR=1 FL=1